MTHLLGFWLPLRKLKSSPGHKNSANTYKILKAISMISQNVATNAWCVGIVEVWYNTLLQFCRLSHHYIHSLAFFFISSIMSPFAWITSCLLVCFNVHIAYTWFWGVVVMKRKKREIFHMNHHNNEYVWSINTLGTKCIYHTYMIWEDISLVYN